MILTLIIRSLIRVMSCIAGVKIAPSVSRYSPASRISQSQRQVGRPVRTTTVVVVLDLCVMLINTAAAMFCYAETVGVLGFLVSGLIALAGIVNEVRFGRNNTISMLLGVLTMAIILYTLYANVYSVPPMPYAVLPYLTSAWILLEIGLLYRKPSLRNDIGHALEAHARDLRRQHVAEYDVIVVGMVIKGVAATYQSARTGLKVLGIEQFDQIGHAPGSSHGQIRVIRQPHITNTPTTFRLYSMHGTNRWN